MLGWTALGIAVGVAGLIVLYYRPWRRLYREVEFEKARDRFRLQREVLEAKFLDLVAASGKPKGLKWENCDFHSPVSFVRDRRTGQLSAFVEVSIRFGPAGSRSARAAEAVRDLRYATAIFHYQHGRWGTGGRVLFNMNPSEAINHFQAQLEAIPSASGP